MRTFEIASCYPDSKVVIRRLIDFFLFERLFQRLESYSSVVCFLIVTFLFCSVGVALRKLASFYCRRFELLLWSLRLVSFGKLSLEVGMTKPYRPPIDLVSKIKSFEHS